MEETNVETITALFYEIWYLLVFSDKKKAAGYAWGLMGLTAKLAQSVSYLPPSNLSFRGLITSAFRLDFVCSSFLKRGVFNLLDSCFHRS
jgi:hypothetical protein